MRQITLTHRLDHSTTLLQWNEVTGELFGDEQLIAEINAYIGFAMDEGYWSLLPTYSYPIVNPRHNALELAVILTTLSDYFSDMALPEVEHVDPYVRDEHGNIVDQVLF